jgi:hypothetical protein
MHTLSLLVLVQGAGQRITVHSIDFMHGITHQKALGWAL